MKLNKTLRETIVKRVVEDVAKAREPALRHREQALAVRLVRARFGKDVFERCRELPEGWLSIHKTISLKYEVRQALPKFVRPGGGYAEPAGKLDLVDYAPLPYAMRDDLDREMVGCHYDAVYALFEDRVELLRELDNLATQTRAVVNAYSTIERLAEGWPAGFALLPAEALKPTGAGLPAPRIEDLDKRIAALKEAA